MSKQRIALNELEYVEDPFLRQLERLGWDILRANKYDPSTSFRDNFTEVIIEKELRKSLKKINPWLDEGQMNEVVREISIPSSNSLLEGNKEILELLLENTSVSKNNQTGESSPTVHFIDFKNPENNSFLAVSQFKVNIPGTERHIIPDIILFVNGLPLVIVECKSSYIADPISEGITQLMRYSNKRGEKEGNEKLFFYNQFQISTCRQTAKYSTITGEFEHYIEWKDPYPSALSDIDTEESESVNSQQILIQGMLTKTNLLDIIQNFTIFQEDDKGKQIKLVPRYQQYRTVQKIVERLKSGKSQEEKGGIVWHTQGSGKSLTMMFIVRKMYHDEDLKKFKVIFVTDRTDLEKQLKGTAKSIGYTLKVAKKIAKLKEYVRTDTPDLIMGMIHKFQETELEHEFPLLNDSKNILVMIDEAHRTQYKLLGANLNKSVPNAVKIAFTGTPVEKTETTFGGYIDKYTMRQAVEDGVTVEIIYEGRTQNSEIKDKEGMNAKFEDVFSAIDDEERAKILGRYTWKAYLEAEDVILDKAYDMVDHFVTHIFPNKFKAQVVAVSRIAAIRYQKALTQAFEEKVSDLEQNEGFIDVGDDQIKIDLDQLKKLKVAAIISGSNNDDPIFKPFTDSAQHEKDIASFKLPFGKEGEDGIVGDIGILVVQSMLLTGFDAPVEQVMYLDNVIREHNLLQAIARVNRVSKHKTAGFIVDYVGIVHHLRKALANFSDKDVNEMMTVMKSGEEDLDTLKFAFAEIKEFFKKFDIDEWSDVDAAVDVLVDEETRNEYISLMRTFNSSMDKVLPKVEALKYAKDLKILGFISQTARNRYRDEKLNLKDASKKIRSIVDEYLIAHGVDPKIPPIPIFDKKFKIKLEDKSDKAKAEELNSAISEHIEKHQEEDPELYERFSEKLEKLLQDYRDNWDQLAKELEQFLEEIRQGREAEETFGLDPKKEAPFLGLLKREIFKVKSMKDLNQDQIDLLVQTTKDILSVVKKEVAIIDFWKNTVAQKRLKSHISTHLLTSLKITNRDQRNMILHKITELAFHLESKI